MNKEKIRKFFSQPVNFLYATSLIGFAAVVALVMLSITHTLTIIDAVYAGLAVIFVLTTVVLIYLFIFAGIPFWRNKDGGLLKMYGRRVLLIFYCIVILSMYAFVIYQWNN